MKAVMISVTPKICEKVASGDCTILVRKTRPKIDTPFKCYIYATKPKKWFRFSSWGSASDENLWLSNGKVKMCDGFEFWADGKEYEPLCGKVIGEFVCDRIEDFYCASVPYQKENNLGYEHFVDNGVYKVDGWHEGVVFERNDRYIDSMLKNKDLDEMRLSAQELFDYIGIGKYLYAWHISDLVIYDKPREIGEFFCKCNKKYCTGCEDFCDEGETIFRMCGGLKAVTRPPQSWCYVEEKEN